MKWPHCDDCDMSLLMQSWETSQPRNWISVLTVGPRKAKGFFYSYLQVLYLWYNSLFVVFVIWLLFEALMSTNKQSTMNNFNWFFQSGDIILDFCDPLLDLHPKKSPSIALERIIYRHGDGHGAVETVLLLPATNLLHIILPQYINWIKPFMCFTPCLVNVISAAILF